MQHTVAPPLPTSPGDIPVIDLDGFRMLASVLGPDRMARMATAFFADAERRMALLDRDARPADLQEHAHALISMAGHLGLRRLSTMCMDLQERARQNGGLEARPVLRRAIDDARHAVHKAVAGGVLHELAAVDGIRPPPPGNPLSGAGRERSAGVGQAASG